MTIEQLETEFDRLKEHLTPYVLRSGNKILNGQNFVKGHIAFLRANSGNKRFMPYYERLLEYYQHIKNKKM